MKVRSFSLYLNLDNSVFHHDLNGELRSIFKGLSENLDAKELIDAELKTTTVAVKDSLGNHVGCMRIITDRAMDM